jgi:hypothetical protein
MNQWRFTPELERLGRDRRSTIPSNRHDVCVHFRNATKKQQACGTDVTLEGGKIV